MPAEKLARDDRLLALAQSALGAPAAGFEGVEAYPKFAQKATVLAWHLIRNHALPDGNKRMGYLALLEFVARNGRSWRVHPAEEEGLQLAREAAAPPIPAASQLAFQRGVCVDPRARRWIAERERK